MVELSLLMLQDYIKILKNDRRTWDAVVTMVLSLLAFLKKMDFCLSPREMEVLEYELFAVMLQAFWVGVEMERSEMAVLIYPRGIL